MANLTDMIKTMKGVGENAEKLTVIYDNYTNIQKRIIAVNDGLQTQAQLQDKVFSAANRSRESYSKMADTFAKLQSVAGASFKTNNEALAFSELMNKSFQLGGADSATQSAGKDQLIEAMGTGKIKSGDFDVISSSAPMMLQAMETFTGKSKEQLRSMAEEGTLTADILKNSLFTASDNIGNKFAELPMTFAGIWNTIKNTALEAFGGVFEFVNSILASDEFQTVLAAVLAGILAIGGVMDWIIGNVDSLTPILEVIGGVLLATIISSLFTAAAGVLAIVSGFMIAHWSLILVVSAIVLVVSALGAMGVTVQDVFGFIGGAIGVFAAVFINYFGFIWNFVAAFINFFGNVFSNPVAAVKALFYDLALNVIGYIATMAHGIEDLINKIPGVEVNMTGGLDKLQQKLEKRSERVKDEAGLKEYTRSTDFINYSDAAAGGAKITTDFYAKISKKITDSKEKLDVTNRFDFLKDSSDQASGNGLGTPSNPATVQGNGANGNLAVDMAEEDIQYLRDIAERDYINKFSTATLAPNIQVSFGPVHQEADADKVADRIQTILREQIAVASEGVY